jgi:peptidoglycan/xylan/chitin deacetylase (PgdA/CDA1 family)
MFSWRHPRVLTFHTVLPDRPEGDALFFYAQPTVREFDDQVRFLRRTCAPLDLDEYLAVMEGRARCPKRAVLVTLDDGYEHSRLAAEVLARHEVPGILFLAVDYIDAHRWTWYLALDWLVENSNVPVVDWRGERFPLDLLSQRKVFRERFKTLYLSAPERDRQALLDDLQQQLGASLPDAVPSTHRFLDWEGVRRLSRDHPHVEIGSHGLSHHDMTRLSDTELEREMKASADRIEEMTGTRPRSISYPDGRHDHRVRAAAASHYRVGFALSPDSRADDPMQQPRLPGLAGGDGATRKVLSPVWATRQAVWRWRAERGWI